MKNLIIFDGMLEDERRVLIKNVQNYFDFREVIAVFRDFPYNEILSRKEILDEYISYVNNGYIFGCYIDDKIAGINCILNDAPSEYSIGFEDESKIAYYSGLAVKKEFRRLGLGKLLVAKTQDYLEKSGNYEMAFARILCENSMSEGIFRINGFEDACYDGKLIVDEVTYERNTGKRETDRRKYMVKKITGTNNYFRR